MPPTSDTFSPCGKLLFSNVCVKRDVDEFSVRSGRDLVPQTGGRGQAGQGGGRAPEAAVGPSVHPSFSVVSPIPWLPQELLGCVLLQWPSPRQCPQWNSGVLGAPLCFLTPKPE